MSKRGLNLYGNVETLERTHRIQQAHIPPYQWKGNGKKLSKFPLGKTAPQIRFKCDFFYYKYMANLYNSYK